MTAYFISAGEPSGDLLAAELVQALQERCPSWEAFGIAGDKMLAAGVQALATIDQLSVMGFVEVIKHLPHLKRLESELLAQIERRQPKLAILVDYPGFHLRLAESLRLRGIKVIQYVAPQLWAWGEKRTERLKRVTDLVLGIMPFEEQFFRERNVNYQYVGTPQVDRVRRHHGRRVDFALEEGHIYIGFFPGSRWGEVTRILPKVKEIRQVLRQRHPEFAFTVSLAPGLSVEAFSCLLTESERELLTTDLQKNGVAQIGDTHFIRGKSLELMQVVDAALVTSGTATLECALSQTPMAVAYVMSGLSYQIAKKLVKLPHISLVNLVAGYGLIKEFIQDFAAEDLADDLARLASDPTARQDMQQAFRGLFKVLQGDLAMHAAQAIQEFITDEAEVYHPKLSL